MAVTLLGDSAVTLPVELRHSERATPILMIATRGVQNPHASEAYVQVLLARGDGRYDDLGTFTFFGAPPNEDEQLFVFALDEDQFQLLASKRARIRTVLKPMHAGGQISAVRIELKAWVEAHVP
jgi:hypothetical protein